MPYSRELLYAGVGMASTHDHNPFLMGLWPRASRTPRPADYAVAQFIEDLALDTEVRAQALLDDPVFHAQLYRLHTRRGGCTLLIAHTAIDAIRRLDETGRFVSNPIRNVYVNHIELPWPRALDAAAYALDIQLRTYIGHTPGTWSAYPTITGRLGATPDDDLRPPV